MSNEIILIFGPPGVGKTTLINLFIKNHDDYVRASAGSLISAEIKEEDRDKLRQLEKNQILQNQLTLIINFQKFVYEHPNSTILFDGHCLLNNEKELVEIPVEVISELNPSRIIFLYDEPQTIVNRRKSDNSRPMRILEDELSIQIFINKAETICRQYSSILNVPLEIISADIQKLTSTIIHPKRY